MGESRPLHKIETKPKIHKPDFSIKSYSSIIHKPNRLTFPEFNYGDARFVNLNIHGTMISVEAAAEGNPPCSGDYGDTTTGVSSYGTGAQNRAWARKVVLDCDGSNPTAYLSLYYGDNTNREIKPCIWNHDGVNDRPSTLVACGTAVYSATWNAIGGVTSAGVITTPLTANTYWVGWVQESSDTSWTGDAYTGGDLHYCANNFTTPAAWDAGTDTPSVNKNGAYLKW